jgi:hypothetical protein
LVIAHQGAERSTVLVSEDACDQFGVAHERAGGSCGGFFRFRIAITMA